MGTTLIYARVSTADRNLEHQEENLWDYAVDELGVEQEDIDVLRDESTGTNTDRSGYREMMERVRAGDVEAVVVRSVTRIGRNMRDIYDTVYEIVLDFECGLYVKNDGLEIDPGADLSIGDRAHLNALGFAAEVEAKQIKERTIEGLRAAEAAGKWTTRPPYGFTTDDDGYLQPNGNFDKAIRAIESVEELDWSHRKAARHSGVPRRTVPNILERKDLYLQEVGDVGE